MANRLKEIFEELRAEGIVTTQAEFAKMLDVHRTTLSAAMNEWGKAYNPTIVAKAEQYLRNVKGDAPAPPPPRKEIIIPPETLELYNNLSRTVLQLSETVDRLLGGAAQKKAE